MRYLAVIPARGGSKGVPKKNIRNLAGKPLIHHTISAARKVFDDADICVSTDSVEIKSVAEDTGIEVPFIRPEELATDTTGSREVLLHALNYYKEIGKIYDAVVMLQPTSPLRRASHIKEALELYSGNIDMVVSVFETSSNPYYVLFEENMDGFLEKSKEGNFTRRQDLPKVWEFNGAVYVINPSSLSKYPISKFPKIVKYVMPEEMSIDIDTEMDFKLAEFLIENQ